MNVCSTISHQKGTQLVCISLRVNRGEAGGVKKTDASEMKGSVRAVLHLSHDVDNDRIHHLHFIAAGGKRKAES